MIFYFYNDKGRWNEHGNNMLCLIDEYLVERFDVRNVYQETDTVRFLSRILCLSTHAVIRSTINEVIPMYCKKYGVDFTIEELVLIECQVRDMVVGCISTSVAENRIRYSIKLRKQEKEQK